MSTTTPFHAGELEAQERAGEGAIAERNGRVVSDSIMAGARPFVAQQSMLVLGSAAADGELWASALFGPAGFLHAAADGRALTVDRLRALSAEGDPLWRNVEHDARLGMLAIELGSRRRLRVNGRVDDVSAATWRVQVEEAYPNCPKYIQRRHLVVRDLRAPESSAESASGRELSAAELDIVRASDTFFVASAHPERGMDASHRGGPPGFVQALDARTLRVPDYAGNSMFNTLGNLSVNPRAGLVFLDFAGGRALQLSGRVSIRWELDDPDKRSAGTRRFWDFDVHAWRRAPLPLGLEWEFLDASPFTPPPL